MQFSTILSSIHKIAQHSLVLMAVLVNAVCFGQAFNDEYNVDDDGPLILTLGINDQLPPGQRIYSLLTQPEFGTFTWLNANTGQASLSVEPQVFFYHNFDYFTFYYEVCVGTFCDTAAIEVQLRFHNDNPFAGDDTLYVETGSARWGDVTLNDGDPDSLSDPNTGTYTSWQIIPPSFADFTVSPIDSFPKKYGTFLYKPIANFIGEDYFTYYRQEPFPCTLNSSPPARVTIIVVPSNENPIAGDATISSAIEEQALAYNLLPLTSDPENEVLQFALAGQPHGGVASVNALGQLTYTSTNNFIGADTVAYTVMDLVGQLDTGYVYIQVANGNNDAPLLSNGTASTSEDSVLNYSIATIDAIDGDALSYQSVSSSSLGSYTVSGEGTITYTPPLNFSGTDIIRYRACDPSGLCDTASVTITIAPVNDAPIAANDFNTTIINGTVTGQMTANDSDIDNATAQLTYILLDAPLHGTAFIQPNGTYSYSPNELYYGEDRFTYRTCDSDGLCDDADVVIDVLYTNLPPSTQGLNAASLEDETIVVDLSIVSTDFNGGDLTFNLLESSTFGTFTPIVNTGFYFVPTENINGYFEIAYRVCDTGNLCDTALITLDITAVNDAPVVEPLTLYVQEDSAVQWFAEYTDIDSDNANLTLEIVEYPQHGTLSNDLTYQGDLNYHGEDAITFNVCDSEGACTSVTHSILIEAVNDTPLATGENVTVEEDSGPDLIPLNNNEIDIDEDVLQYILISDAGPHVISFSNSGLMSIIPSANFNGIIELEYAVCDAGSLCDTATLVITVTPINDAPQSNFPALSATEDIDINFDPAAYVTDIDGNPLTYSIVSSQGVAATFNPGDQTYALQPVSDFFGNASVVIQVCDGNSSCTNDTLIIDIQPVNDAPIVSDIDVFTFVNIPAEGELIGFVSDVDDISFTAMAANNALGNLTIDSALHFSYIPAQDFVGINSIEITICDSSGLCDTALFLIQVYPPNQAPQATGGSFEMCQAQSFTIPIATLVSDDAQSAAELSYLFSASAPAQITLGSPANEVIVSPSSLYSGLMTIDMIVCDNASPALCDTAQYEIEVVPAFTPEITGAIINAVSCHGANDGSIIINSTTDINSTTFQWSNGSEGNALTALAPGDYAVTMISNTPCSLQGSAAFSISEPDALEATFSATNISAGANGSIEVIISGGTAPYSVNWTGPNGFTAATNSLIGLSADGMYLASITDANDCTTGLEVMLTSREEQAVQSFGVYPNPITENNLIIELTAAMPLPCPYIITDLSGKVIQQGAITSNRQTLDVSQLAGGCYLISVSEQVVRLLRY
ncbi:MAG: Ig-like domain-containing protein [Flavobacteriales bacterium]|jgi:hypothetical protein